MLSEAQFAAIGRLTLAFNRVEAAIDGYAGLLLGAAESSVAGFIVEREQNITRKVSFLIGIIEAVLRAHPGLAETAEKAIIVLRKVMPLAVRRNDIVNSLVATDEQGNAVLFNKWKRSAPDSDVASLDLLAEETAAVAMNIVMACGDLERELLAKRKR